MDVADLVRIALPRSGSAGRLIVLTAYFDDSGTHAKSEVVLMGGLYGGSSQWAALEEHWRALLANPGKDWKPLSRFHMYECEHGIGEFEGQTQGARDHLVFKFRNLILEADLGGYAMAVSRRDWERMVIGDQLGAWGDAERFAVTQCILTTLEWAESASVETDVSFVFDDRPQRRDSNRRVYSIYEHYAETVEPTPKPAGIAFVNSDAAIPLQAADMFAWESYRYIQAWLKERGRTKARAHFQRFLETKRFRLQCASPEAIEQLVASVKPGSEEEATLSHMAAFFNAPSDGPFEALRA